jgi:hypothetical protein
VTGKLNTLLRETLIENIEKSFVTFKLVHVLLYDILGRYFGMTLRYFGMKIYYDFSQFSCEIYSEANSRLKRLSDFIKKFPQQLILFF